MASVLPPGVWEEYDWSSWGPPSHLGPGRRPAAPLSLPWANRRWRLPGPRPRRGLRPRPRTPAWAPSSGGSGGGDGCTAAASFGEAPVARMKGGDASREERCGCDGRDRGAPELPRRASLFPSPQTPSGHRGSARPCWGASRAPIPAFEGRPTGGEREPRGPQAPLLAPRPAEPAGGPPGVPWPPAIARWAGPTRGTRGLRHPGATDFPTGAPPAPPAPTRSKGSFPNLKSEAEPPHPSQDQRTRAGPRRVTRPRGNPGPLLTGVRTLPGRASLCVGPEARGPHSAPAAPLPPPEFPPPRVFTCLGREERRSSRRRGCQLLARRAGDSRSRGGGIRGGEGRRRRSRAEVGAGTNCSAARRTLGAHGGRPAEV